jgi:GMP synthase-like glutamine amidotransferase
MTKILVVNNDSDTWQELLDTVRDCGYEAEILHCQAVRPDSGQGCDAAILSGGWWYDDAAKHLEVYQGEIDFITHTSLPTLGICIGMQLMQLAFSGLVPQLDEPQKDLQTISVLPEGQKLLSLPEQITVHKNHTLGVVMPADGFTVLAASPDHVEIIKHATRPLLGVQFHPEVGEHDARIAMLQNLLETTIRLSGKKPASKEDVVVAA